MANDERGGPKPANKGMDKAVLDAIEAKIREGKTKHQAINEVMLKGFKPVPKG
jgi:hypothetical protein